MCKVISRGIYIAPGPHCRLVRMNDAKARSKFDLHYLRIGKARVYEVYQGSGPDRRYLGQLLGSYITVDCWAFIPHIFGVGSRWYLAPTRFEAINACFCFLDSYSEDNS